MNIGIAGSLIPRHQRLVFLRKVKVKPQGLLGNLGSQADTGQVGLTVPGPEQLLPGDVNLVTHQLAGWGSWHATAGNGESPEDSEMGVVVGEGVFDGDGGGSEQPCPLHGERVCLGNPKATIVWLFPA